MWLCVSPFFTFYWPCPVHSPASQWIRATGRAPLPCVGVIVFLYKLSGCITVARTLCLPCSHHEGYWGSTTLAANTASISPCWFKPSSWAGAEITSGSTRRSEAPSWVSYFIESPYCSREVKLERKKTEEKVEWLDHNRVGVMSSCAAAQTWQIGKAGRWQTDRLNTRTSRYASRQTNREAAGKTDRKKTKRQMMKEKWEKDESRPTERQRKMAARETEMSNR